MKIVIPGERGVGWQKFYAGGHWSVRKQDADYAHQLIRSYIDPNTPPFACRVDITVTVYFDKQPQDPDNICDKLWIDGLKGWVIKDDNYRYVRRATTQAEIDKHNPRVEIEVVPVQGGDS